MSNLAGSDTVSELLPELEELKAKILEELASQHEDAFNLLTLSKRSTSLIEGYWEVDLKTQETTVTDSWVKISGYSKDEVNDIMEFAQKVIFPDDLQRLTSLFHQFIEEKAPYNTHYRIKHKDGSIRWIAVRAELVKDKQGKPIRSIGLNIDITRSIAERHVLLESEKKYRAIFENSLVAIFRSTLKEGIIIDANRKTWDLLDRAPAQGVSLLDYYATPEQRQNLLKMLEKGEKISNYEVRIISHKGVEKWVACSVVLNKTDQVLECVAQDITELKLRVQELEKLNFELDSFVYHASHDLRSPLKSILGLVNLVRQDNSTEFLHSSINMIETSIRKLDVLVEDLLSISRNQRVELEAESFNFLNEIESSLESFHYSENSKGLVTRIKVNQSLPFVTDPSRVRIILNNLISNAIKYRSFVRDESYINIEAKVSKHKAVLTIADNGEGIPEKMVDKIFDMFVRASERSSGSGLGLYIVKNIVEKLSGSITLESEVGKGTTFRIELPNIHLQEKH